MPRFLDRFHHTQHDDKHKDDTASASSGKNSRDSKHLLAQPSSPPPYAEGSKQQHFGLSSDEKAAATRAPGAINKNLPNDVGVAASYSSSQSDSKGTDPGPSTRRTSLQVCQHENLTFERLQLIKGLLYDKYLKDGIDIIGNTEEKQHHEIKNPLRLWPPDVWACCADDQRRDTVGTSRMKLSSKPHNFFGHKSGHVVELELHVNWTFKIGRAISDKTRDQINLYLQKSDKVPLCPHKMMNDPWIQDTIYNFPIGRDASKPTSIDIYMQYTHKSTQPPVQNSPAFACDRCKTHVKVSYESIPDFPIFDQVKVEITRHLGEGILENDPTWLAQCGIEP